MDNAGSADGLILLWLCLLGLGADTTTLLFRISQNKCNLMGLKSISEIVQVPSGISSSPLSPHQWTSAVPRLLNLLSPTSRHDLLYCICCPLLVITLLHPRCDNQRSPRRLHVCLPRRRFERWPSLCVCAWRRNRHLHLRRGFVQLVHV